MKIYSALVSRLIASRSILSFMRDNLDGRWIVASRRIACVLSNRHAMRARDAPLSTCANGDRLAALGYGQVGGSTLFGDNPHQFSLLTLPPSLRFFSSRISAKLPSANKGASMVLPVLA